MIIRKLVNPDFSKWNELVQRPAGTNANIEEKVDKVMQHVRMGGDAALRELTLKFDHVDLDEMKIAASEIETANTRLSSSLRAAIDQAYENISTFHRPQITQVEKIETMPEVFCWRESRAIDPVGLYIPGGTAPLFSTVLMLGIPAGIAGCKEIVLCTPPSRDGKVAPEILYASTLCGIEHIYRVGGAQAIAAMTFGTASVPAVHKIFGPGNQFVTEAKMQAQRFGVGIDMPAGPSEVLIIADESANPNFVAADMLSQAEHGSDSQVVLLSNSEGLIAEILKALSKQLEQIPRRDLAAAAIENSLAIQFDLISTCLDFSNIYAPEHLILSVDQPEKYIDRIQSAGSVFLGHYSPESVGDYASGTNHTLPTNGWASSYSGVSVDSFVKKITFQKVSKKGLTNVGPIVEEMAAAESLLAHKNAVSIRLREI